MPACGRSAFDISVVSDKMMNHINHSSHHNYFNWDRELLVANFSGRYINRLVILSLLFEVIPRSRNRRHQREGSGAERNVLYYPPFRPRNDLNSREVRPLPPVLYRTAGGVVIAHPSGFSAYIYDIRL